ncbi:uncharacterized protein K441DRAFT_191407 [Cenococcum geophilum 1.58]|uniref:uncharacterized protein n=1 Tax=Cenococcum geophilum 1.58 TaxID=794803 RepID=UPI0035901E10|nr:hypothetical protein K441DRAFT_191407 [Cenococcum geophilum 1.58]
MTSKNNWLLQQKFDAFDRDKLMNFARDLQNLANKQNDLIVTLREKADKIEDESKKRTKANEEEIARVRREVQIPSEKERGSAAEVSAFQKTEEQENYFGSLSTPLWIRAEHDYPDEAYFSCFHRKFPTVLVYDPKLDSLTAQSVQDLQGQRAIISRLPSRWSRAIHVHIERMSTNVTASNCRVRVTTKDRTVKGLEYYCTINLKHIAWDTKLNMLLGNIRWLFILRAIGESGKRVKDEKG